MSKQSYFIVIISLLIGGLLTWGWLNINSSKTYSNNQMEMHASEINQTGLGMHGAMDSMMSGINNKTGDEFDKAFISEMIVHHQGAIDMAELALKNAKHQEIKNLAKAIIEAQSKEIKQMQNWQASWFSK